MFPKSQEKIKFKCPTCWTEYEVDAKFEDAVDKQIELGYCKFCHRKDPNIPTTAEMDKLFTVEDMRNRFFAMILCNSCDTWNKVPLGKDIITRPPCTKCESTNYDGETIMSVRSWSPELAKKRKKKSKSKK